MNWIKIIKKQLKQEIVIVQNTLTNNTEMY